MPAPDHASATRATNHWELLAAVALLLAVLTVIDTAAIHQPELAFSLCPLVFFVLAAIHSFTLRGVAIWIAGLGAVALLAGDLRYVFLSYPAVVLGALLAVRGFAQRRAPRA